MRPIANKGALVASLLVAMCGTACTDEHVIIDPIEFPTLQGFLDISESRIAGQSELSLVAGFTSYGQKIVPVHALSEERCNYAGSDPTIEITRSGRAIPPQGIDAGPVILSNSQGTLATMSDNSGEFYEQYEQAAFMVPVAQTSGMTLDVTGGVYPALSNIRVLEIDDFDLIEPALGTTGSSTSIAWTPSVYDKGEVNFFVQFNDGSELSNHYCRVFDDGEFDLSEKFSLDFSTTTVTLMDIERKLHESHFVDDVYLGVTRYIKPTQ